tara:strand:- start:310 stop:2778 length:2469 start_codon:yes stop_codon:yes gene_type:complete
MPNTQNHTTPLRILLIEDVENDAQLLIDHLHSEGLILDWKRVDTERDMNVRLQESWDIIVSDFTMPHLSGTRALEIVRQHDLDIPFIFVSGTIGEDAAVKAMKSGAQDYIMKDNLNRLLPAIERELREAQARREHHQTEQILRKLSLVVKQATDSVFITDSKGRIEYVNPAFEKLTGYAADEIQGCTSAVLRSGKHDTVFFQKLWRIINCGEVFKGILINRRKNGELFHEEKVIAPLKDVRGHITHFVSTGRDITARAQVEEENSRLISILEATPDLVAIFEQEGRLRYLNKAGRRLLGLDSEEEISTLYMQDLVLNGSTSQRHISQALLDVREHGIWSGETVLRRAEGKELPVSQVILEHRNTAGRIEYLSTIMRDISERKHLEAELRHNTSHDRLTDLPNRFFLTERFMTALEYAKRHGEYVAVLFLDLDNFKRVNDNLGHTAGDTLLQQVAERLKRCFRLNDTVARYGGDEFTILANDIKSSDDVLRLLQKLSTAFERPIIIGSHNIYTTFSIGIALYPYDGDQIEDLLHYADIAMYQAKAIGPNQYRFYTSEMNTHSHDLLKLEEDLRLALERDEFLMYYQPQLDSRSDRIIGIEGLIRWQHPLRGLVLPADFIPLLENSGMIIPVGEWVMRQACRTHRTILKAGFDNFRVSINVSAAQFDDEYLFDKINRTLQDEQMPQQALEIEITENVLIKDPMSAAETLRAIHALGVRTAIDDFGTGYSSLAYLKRFPLNVLKIDRTFVSDLFVDPSDAAIVEASISLAHKLGLQVIAEGVETAQQLEFLRTHGCDMVQGYYINKPLTLNELMKFLQIKLHQHG